MTFTVPTAEEFVTRFPTFSLVDNSAIATALAEAALHVDDTWGEGSIVSGQMLYAAHVLTLDGLGTGAEAQMAAQGLGIFQSMTSGAMSLQRASNGDGSVLGMTTFGRRFQQLLRMNFGGIAVANVD